MAYSIGKLSKMSGLSVRTLRYYDEIGLLKPASVAPNGYRYYGTREADVLQQILFYRTLGFPLDDIGRLMAATDYDRERAFQSHLDALNKERGRLDALIHNLQRSLAAMKGEDTMTDAEKFEGLKQSLIDENEKNYGKEVREKYGDAEADAANAHVRGLSKEQIDEAERLNRELETALKAAIATGDPAGEAAQHACDLHKQWLRVYYPKYSKEYHRGLGEMYVADERFTAYYERIAPGCAAFLRDAINIYCGA